MIAAASCREISLNALDQADHTFVFPPVPDLSSLKASLQEVGLLNPPWVRAVDGDRFQVVTGWKRLLAAVRLGWEEVTARVLPADTPEARCLLIHLHDNALSRGFNPLEQALLVVRLQQHWDRQTVIQKFLPCLGLAPSLTLLERLLALAVLEEPLQLLAARGRLSLPAAQMLASWGPRDRGAVAAFLEELPLSQSKQEEFLQGLDLLARREGAPPAEILSREEFRQYLRAEAGNLQAKAAAVRLLLQKLVSPRFSAAQQGFQTGLQRLGLRHHPRLRLQPPPAFEGPDFHLEVKFRDAAELQKLLEELGRLARDQEFSDLTSI